MRDWRGIVFPLGLVAAAELVAHTTPIRSDALAAPSRVLAACLQVLEDGSFLTAAAQTLLAAAEGLLIGGAAGLVGGVLLGLAPRLAAVFGLSIALLGAIPAVAVLPVGFLAFGLGPRMEIAVIALACFWPALILTWHAFAQVDERLFDVAKLLRLGARATFAGICLPIAAPRLVNALRLATALSLVVTIAIEMIAIPQGIGRSLLVARDSLRPDRMWAMLVYLGLIAVLSDGALRRLARSLCMDRSGRGDRRMTRTRAPIAPGGVVGALALLGLWQACAAYQISPTWLPSPASMLAAMQRGVASGDLLSQFAATVLRLLTGWSVAGVVAVALGALIGGSEPARAYFRPTIAVLCALPATAVVPPAIALLGLGPTMILAVIALGALWPTLLGTIAGIAEVEPRLIEVATLMRLGRVAVIREVALPGALPRILVGMRQAFATGLMLTIVGEMVTDVTGLGARVLVAARTFSLGDVFAGVALLGSIGLLGNYALVLVERRALVWRP